MGRSMRARVIGLALAGARDALETIEARVAGQLSGSALERQRERTREILERDRALLETAVPADPPVAAAGPAPSTAPAREQNVVCDEPIRTRVMAKLLAAQGYPHRALAIYRYLLVHDDSDPALQAEIAALQAHLGAHERAASTGANAE